jgi:serine/threonine-protein kinase
MTSEPPASTIERLFELALAYGRCERAAFLERECSDQDMRREIESLLDADEQAHGFWEPPLQTVHAPDDRIGPYRLLRKVSDGETSSVYLAARDDGQYHQQIAIKLIRPGAASRHVLQRFRQERQILASLVHPNIARLLDGGTTSAGQPYLIMEYVDGEPLDVHCQQRKLSLTRRLELFIVVCQAVHFAHRSLVVHRDLKPSNILVGADGTPKLLDFGIAKLLDPEALGICAARTATVARVMTPYYASPEQVSGKSISTASDIYSLGVLLYQLLTGHRPYDFRSLSLHEIERVVCEAVPLPPSRALCRSPRARLPRDVDNIVLMAMRKEPERRYASAQELADDLRRCLAREPVRARPDTLGYRMSSFVRRHTGAVAAAAGIFLVLTAGVLVTTWQWRRAVVAQAHIETQRRIAQQSLEFVVDLFKVPEAPVAVRELTARELLERGAARLRGGEEPRDVHAALQHTLGVVYRNLGDFRQAARLLEEAVAERSSAPGSEPELADSLYQLGAISAVVGSPDRARALLARALAIREQLLGPDDLSVADVLEELADNVGYKVPLQEAQDDMRRALDIRRHDTGDDDPQLSSRMVKLAKLYTLGARDNDAERLVQEALRIRSRSAHGEACRATDGDFFENLWYVRFRQGYFHDAERYLESASAA